MNNKSLKKTFILIILTIIFIISCPNTDMRDLVELKVSDPVADSFIIEDGTPTSTLKVLLYSNVTKEDDALEMRFKNKGFSWSEWEPYSSTKTWELSLGDGEKKVYAEYRDEGHHVVEMENIINLNTGAPSVEGFYIWGSAVSGNRHEYINSTSVTLCMSVSNVEQMRFSNDNTTWSEWEQYSSAKSWELPAGDGEITVYAQFKTNADVSTPDSVTNLTPSGNPPVLDTTLPSVTGFQILSVDDENNEFVNNTGVTLSYNYTEANTVWAEYMNDGGSWSEMGDPVSTASVTDALSTKDDWSLRSAKGTRNVYVRLTDIAGNVSSVYSDTIYLNNEAPAAPVVTAATPTANLRPTWSWEEVNGAESYIYSFDGIEWSGNTSETQYMPDTDLDENETHTLYVKAVDSEGRESESGYASVYTDTEKPEISSVSLNNWCFKTGDEINISFYVEDESSFLDLYVTVDGYKIIPTLYAGSESLYAASYTVTGDEGDGEKSVYIIAEDYAENMRSHSATITIDNIAPTITWFRINNDNTYSCSPVVQAFVLVADNVTANSDLWLNIIGRNGGIYVPNVSNYTQNYYNIRSEDGYFEFHVRDEAGNSSSVTRTITQKTGTVDTNLEDQSLPSHIGLSAFDLGNMSDYDYGDPPDPPDPSYNSPSTMEHYPELNLWDEDWFKIYIDGGSNPTFTLWGSNGATVRDIVDVEFYSDEDGNNEIGASSIDRGTNIEYKLTGNYQDDNQKTVWIKVLKDSAADDYTGVEYALDWVIDY